MRKILFLIFVISLITNIAFAQESEKKNTQEQKQSQNQNEKKSNQKFVDLDGDGFNDNAPDHDGDGINDNKLQEQSRERQRTFGPASSAQDPKGSPQVKSEEQKQQHKGKKGKK